MGFLFFIFIFVSKNIKKKDEKKIWNLSSLECIWGEFIIKSAVQNINIFMTFFQNIFIYGSLGSEQKKTYLTIYYARWKKKTIKICFNSLANNLNTNFKTINLIYK